MAFVLTKLQIGLILALLALALILILSILFLIGKPKPTGKTFRLTREQIRPLATGHGGCIATDKIVVGGNKVGFMYRETADNEVDSGWRFLSGHESDEYMDNSNNHGAYDVNTIANYDPEIIPFLDAPVGSAFERPGGNGPFVEVENYEPRKD